MKKYLPNISKILLTTVAVIAMGGFILPQKLEAQIPAGGCPAGQVEVNDPTTGLPFCATGTNATQVQQELNTGNGSSGCDQGWVGCQIMERVLPGIANLMLNITSFLTGVSAVILNGVIFHTVVHVSDNYEKIASIESTWKVVRDIANMAFIFVLLYAAINTIIGTGQDNKRLIVNVVIFAILINFSLFFTRVIIDTSNIMALTFYDAIAPQALDVNAPWAEQKGLSNAFMNHMNLQSLWKAPDIDAGTIITIGVMGSIMLLVAAFVFFAVAILFIIRYVILILVLVLSPIAFVASALPSGTGIEKYRQQWSQALLGQAFFAPIYFMLTWVTLNVLSGITTSLIKTPEGTTTNFTTALGSLVVGDAGATVNTGAFIMFINFVIVIVLLITSLIVAKSWADRGGVGLSKWATGVAGGATIGMAGRFGRGTLGRAGGALAESEWLKNKATTSTIARIGLAATRKTAGASFDARGISALGALGAGKAQKGGFTKDMEEKVKAEKKYAESLKPSDLLVAKTERELDNAKKTGTIADVAAAQTKLDRLKGASEDDMRARKIKELRASGLSKKQAKERLGAMEDERLRAINRFREEGVTEEAAKEKAKQENIGWEAEKIKGKAVERKEAYAKDKETSATVSIPIPKTGKVIPFSFTGRVGFVGPVKRERQEEALAIRKSIKEKKPAEKISEEIKNQTEAASDESSGPEPTTPPPAPSPSPATP